MKSPKTKKVVKAWAVLTNGKLNAPSDIRSSKENAVIYAGIGGSIVPCTITYQLSTKKSAGKKGKRKAV